jgi:hypothetical protein
MITLFRLSVFLNSIFLTYQGDQPFANFGSKTLGLGVASIPLPSAPVHDGQTRGLVSEFVRVGFDGDIGPLNYRHLEAGPTGKRRGLYRSDARSQYAVLGLDSAYTQWHIATVTFDGNRVPMIWSSDFREHNRRATKLARQPDTVLPATFTQPDIVICGNVYLVLRQMWKPTVDIRTTKYPSFSDFEREVRPLIKGWWHAIEINGGWRLYADDKDELFWAKLKIRT